jgi:hypothetical protein
MKERRFNFEIVFIPEKISSKEAFYWIMELLLFTSNKMICHWSGNIEKFSTFQSGIGPFKMQCCINL